MSSLFGSPQKPAVMPDPQNPVLKEANLQKFAKTAGAAGRQSTILTGGTYDTFGSSQLGTGAATS